VSHGSLVDLGTMVQARRSWVRYPVRLLNRFKLPNPSSRTRPWILLQIFDTDVDTYSDSVSELFPDEGYAQGRQLSVPNIQEETVMCC
jgi:hypothetical protein